AGAAEAAAEVAARYRDWRQAVERRERAEHDSAASERERELLAWQVRELEELAFDADEWQELNQEHARLAHAAGLMSGADEVLVALGDGELAAAPMLASLGNKVGEMAGIDASLEEVRSLLA